MFEDLCTPAYVILICYIIHVILIVITILTSLNLTVIIGGIIGIIFASIFQFLWIWLMNYLCSTGSEVAKGIAWFFAILAVLSATAILFGDLFAFVNAVAKNTQLGNMGVPSATIRR
jgi:hypothetical protein